MFVMTKEDVYVSWVMLYVFWVMLCQENGRTSEDYVYEYYLRKEKEQDLEV